MHPSRCGRSASAYSSSSSSPRLSSFLSLPRCKAGPPRCAAVPRQPRIYQQVAAGDKIPSTLAAEEALGLILQLDCDIQLQRCLNTEAYTKAQEVRSKRIKLDGQIKALMERKMSRQQQRGGPGEQAGGARASGGLSAADLATEGLRLRAQMQRAVEEERYKEAGQIKELLSELDKQSKRLAALTAERSAAEPKLRLGQRVSHIQQGYRGLVIGWDLQCCESDDWIQSTGARPLMDKTFYHVLVDVRDWSPYGPGSDMPPVAYVAEPLLTAPELEPEGLSWVEVHGVEPLEHPFVSLLFLGRDGRGDYLPCRHMRNKYNVVRRDVYRPGQEPGAEPGAQADV